MVFVVNAHGNRRQATPSLVSATGVSVPGLPSVHPRASTIGEKAFVGKSIDAVSKNIYTITNGRSTLCGLTIASSMSERTGTHRLK